VTLDDAPRVARVSTALDVEDRSRGAYGPGGVEPPADRR